MKNKINILAVAVAVLLLTIISAKAQVENGNQIPDAKFDTKMEGSWKVIVTPFQSPIPLPPSFESIITYVPGGGLIESDTLAAPNSIAGAGHGVWELTEDRRRKRQFNLNFTKFLFTTAGQFAGSVKITEKITLTSGDQYVGEGKLQTLSPTGAVIVTIPITTIGTRIHAEQQTNLLEELQ